MDREVIVTAVVEHARAHYDREGWDYVIETMNNEDIASDIESAQTVAQAVERIGRIVKRLNEQRAMVQREIF